MAVSHTFYFTEKCISYDFDILQISDQFRSKTPNKCAIAVQEVLGSYPEIEVDLIWDFSDASEEVKKLATKEKNDLHRDYALLEKQWGKNLRNRKPIWANLSDDDVFISSKKYKYIFRQKIKPIVAPIQDDSRYDSNF